MVLNLALILAGMSSVAVLWYRMSKKIPELVAIPDEVIIDRLHEDSARVRIFFLHFKTFYREGGHRAWFWKVCERSCHRAHIWLLRADNAVVAALHKLRAESPEAAAKEKDASVNEEYLGRLFQERRQPLMGKTAAVSDSAASVRSMRRTIQRGRMHEVRVRSVKAPE